MSGFDHHRRPVACGFSFLGLDFGVAGGGPCARHLKISRVAVRSACFAGDSSVLCLLSNTFEWRPLHRRNKPPRDCLRRRATLRPTLDLARPVPWRWPWLAMSEDGTIASRVGAIGHRIAMQGGLRQS
jgi:hypothetical protein